MGRVVVRMKAIREQTPFKVTARADRLSRAERERILADPGFGNVFSEHLVHATWDRANGWHDHELRPYGPVQLDPGALVFHYSQSVFEGLKAFHQEDGGVAVFRRDWVPTAAEHSMYLRPFMYATEVTLSVHPSATVDFFLIASPSASYFASGVKPVTVWLSEDFTRAAKGGTGGAKTGGNYAGGLLAHAQAVEQGCDQVVWLDANEHRWVEEMGGMNIFFVLGRGSKAKLMTPALTGTLLPGITRDALLVLGRELGYETEEGRISTAEWQEGCASGAISEAFACGTAAVITPIGAVKSKAASWTVGDGQPGQISMELRQALVDIQRGASQDKHGWMHRVPGASA